MFPVTSMLADTRSLKLQDFPYYQPLKKAYAAMGKKGSWNTSSQNTKDLNHTGGSCIRGSLNSLEYHRNRLLNWKRQDPDEY